MKFGFLLCLLAVSLSGCFDNSDKMIGGVFFKCTRDFDQQRHFAGMSGRDVLESEAKKTADANCDNLTGGTATEVVYVYKDGSQKAAE